MKNIDVIIIGNDLAALAIGTYLTRHLRDVVILDLEEDAVEERIRKPKLFGGVQSGSIFKHILNEYNIQKKFKFEPIDTYMYKVNGDFEEVPLTFEKYKLYLIQKFPKDRNEIRRFFDELAQLYGNYVEMEILRINSQPYTLPNIFIEWGSKTVKEVLNQYFDNPDLEKQFIAISGINGVNYDALYAPNFFINWFYYFIEGAGFLGMTHQELREELYQEFTKHNGEIIQTSLKKVHYEEGVIKYFEGPRNKRYSAKYYVYSGSPLIFNSEFLKEASLVNSEIIQRFPNLDKEQHMGSCVIRFDKPLKSLKLPEKLTLIDVSDKIRVEHIDDSKVDVFVTEIMPTNESKYLIDDAKSACFVSFIDYAHSPDEEIIKTVVDLLVEEYSRPSLKKHIHSIELCEYDEFSIEHDKAMLNLQNSIQEQFDNVNFNNIFDLSNLFFVGSWSLVEMGIQGDIINGFVQGEKVEDLLALDESKDLIDNDILISALAHEFKSDIIDKQFFKIQFEISNHDYYFLIEDKELEVYHGEVLNPDLKITTTNRDLFNIMAGKEKITSTIRGKKMDVEGDKDYLDQFSMAFNLSQKSIYKYRNFQSNTYRNHIGVKLLIANLIVWIAFSLIINVMDVVLASTSALGGIITYGVFKRKYDKYTFFDIFSVVAFLGFGIYSLVNSDFNTSNKPDMVFLVLSITWLASWISGRPMIFGYIKNDYPIEFSNTKLFKIISGGLTFIWGIMFMIMYIINLLVNMPYQLLTYYVIFVGIYLTVYYPKAYIRSYIKKG